MGAALKLTYRGKTQTLREWSDELGIPRTVLYYRVSSGWGVQRALTTPIRKMRLAHRNQKLRDLYEYVLTYKMENDGASPSYRGIAERYDMSLSQAKSWVCELEEMGLLSTTNKARSIRVRGGKWVAPSIDLEEVFNGDDGDKKGY